MAQYDVGDSMSCVPVTTADSEWSHDLDDQVCAGERLQPWHSTTHQRLHPNFDHG